LSTHFSWLLLIVAIDVAVGGTFPTDANNCFTEYLVNFFMVVIPGICFVVTGLLYSSLMVEN